MEHLKRASISDVEKAASLLDSIYRENPVNWPNGLGVGHFNKGDLFLIYKSANTDPVGFVGWQERPLFGIRAGFYSIGTLPRYRGEGIAKQAVAQLLDIKSRGVDKVYALVVDGNMPSEKLAAKLGIPVIPYPVMTKSAGKLEIAKKVLNGLAGGSATMLYQDNVMHSGREGHNALSAFDPGANSTRDNLINLMNFGFGAAGAHGIREGGRDYAAAREARNIASATPQGLTSQVMAQYKADAGDAAKKIGAGIGSMTVVPMTKDLILDSHRGLDAVERMSKNVNEGGKSVINQISQASPLNMLLGGGAIAAGGLGAGYLISKAIRDRPAATGGGGAAQGGRLRVTLPTRNQGDAETVVDLPYDPQTSLTNALRQRLEMDTKRRLYAETRARVHRRNAGGNIENVH